MVGDLLGMLDGAAILQVGGDAGGPKRMAANGFRQANCFRPHLDHPQGVVPVHRPGSQHPLAVDGAEEPALAVGGDASRSEVCV